MQAPDGVRELEKYPAHMRHTIENRTQDSPQERRATKHVEVCPCMLRFTWLSTLRKALLNKHVPKETMNEALCFVHLTREGKSELAQTWASMTLITSSPPRMGSEVAAVSEEGENSWMLSGLFSSSAVVPMVLEERWATMAAVGDVGNQSPEPDPGRLSPNGRPEKPCICIAATGFCTPPNAVASATQDVISNMLAVVSMPALAEIRSHVPVKLRNWHPSDECKSLPMHI